MEKNQEIDQFLKKFQLLLKEDPNQKITSEYIRRESILYGLNQSYNSIDLTKIKEYLTREKDSKVIEDDHFLHVFSKKGTIGKDCMKLYIPFSKNHFNDNVITIIDYLQRENMTYQYQVAKSEKNDDFIVRVNKIEEAKKIIHYINQNDFLKEKMIKGSPFLPKVKGIGLIRDYFLSYNNEISQLIEEYFQLKSKNNQVDDISKIDFCRFLEEQSKKSQKEELKQIYSQAFIGLNAEANTYINYLETTEKETTIFTEEEKEMILHRAIVETYRKYHDTNLVKEGLFLCTQGSYHGITKENDSRKYLSKISPLEIKQIILRMTEETDLRIAISDLVDQISINEKEVNIDLRSKMNHVILENYKNKGKETTIDMIYQFIRHHQFGEELEELQSLTIDEMKDFFLLTGGSFDIRESITNYINQLIGDLDMENHPKK